MKAKSEMELNLARDVKDSKKTFCKYIGDKRQTKENVGPLLNELGDLVTQDIEKVDVPYVRLSLVFTSKTRLQESQTLEIRGRVWSMDGISLVKEDHGREYQTYISPQTLTGCSHEC